MRHVVAIAHPRFRPDDPAELRLRPHTTASVRLVRVAALALAIYGSTGCAAARHRENHALLPLISTRGNVLSWGGLALQTTRVQVQRQLGKSLEVYRLDHPACGSWSSTVETAGRRGELQWSDATDEAELESVTFSLTQAEVAATAIGLAHSVAARERGVEVDPHSQPWAASLHLVSRPSHVLLIKAGNESIAFLSLEECLD